MRAAPEAPYPARLAFLVEFGPGDAARRAGPSGRVEHVVTGRSARFSDLAELSGFLSEHGVPGSAPEPEGDGR